MLGGERDAAENILEDLLAQVAGKTRAEQLPVLLEARAKLQALDEDSTSIFKSPTRRRCECLMLMIDIRAQIEAGDTDPALPRRMDNLVRKMMNKEHLPKGRSRERHMKYFEVRAQLDYLEQMIAATTQEAHLAELTKMQQDLLAKIQLLEEEEAAAKEEAPPAITALLNEMELSDEPAQATHEASPAAADASSPMMDLASKCLHDLCKRGYGPGTRGPNLTDAQALEAMNELLDQGADPNYVDTESDDVTAPAGATPLIWAVRMNSEAWVRRLLAANADPTIEDRSPFAAYTGATALDSAEMWAELQGEVTEAKLEENQRIIELLSEGGAHAGASAA